MDSENNVDKNITKKDYLPFEPQMTPSEENKLNYKRTILISLSFFTVLLAWSYFNFKVPLLIEDLLPGNPFLDLIKGSIMAIDNIIAVILQPVFGDLSDRTRSKFGRRMPYIIIGTTTGAIFFIMIPWIQIIAGLVLIIFLFDLAMSIYRSASIAILPDYTSNKVYSKASAVQQFTANIGGLLAFAIPIILGFIPGLSKNWVDAFGFIIVGALMIVLLLVQIFKLKETPTGDSFLRVLDTKLEVDSKTYNVKEIPLKEQINSEKKGRLNKYKEFIEIVKNHKDFAYFLGAVIFMYLAFASVESFFSSFAINYLGLYDAAFAQVGNAADATKIAESQAGTLFLAYSGPMIAVAYFVGLLGQNKKVGRKNAVKFFLGWLLISIIIMSFVVTPFVYKNHNPLLIITILILIAIPWMGFIVNSFSILWALAPEGEGGTYTGIYYTFNQAAYTLAPILFGGILMITGWIFPPLGLGFDFRYIIMFPFILVCVIIAILFFRKVKGGEADEE
jgi:MFS family permease